MKTFYVIVTRTESVPAVRLCGWTDNPFIAITYFREYKNMDKNSHMNIYDCHTVLELSKILRDSYGGVELTEFTNSLLRTKTSKDGRCYVIYRDIYSELFSDDYLSKKDPAEFPYVSLHRALLSMMPILKYINAGDVELDELLTNLIFNGFAHTSVKRFLRLNKPIDEMLDMVDIVYLWRFINYSRENGCTGILNMTKVTQPVDAVFIDSN